MKHKRKKKLGILLRFISSPLLLTYLVITIVINNIFDGFLSSIGLILLAFTLYLFTPLIKFGKRNRYIYSVKKRLENNLNIKRRMIYRGPIEDLETTVSGSAGFGIIVLSQDLIRIYNEKPLIIDFFLGHELSHYKFNDIKSQRKYRKLMKNSDDLMEKNKATISHIITEIRADITSALINKFSIKEYNDTLSMAHLLNEGDSWKEQDSKFSYDRGYPSRKERIKYPLRCIKLRNYNLLNKDRIDNFVIKPLIVNFCRVKRVNQSDISILVDYAIQDFWKVPVAKDILVY